MYPKHSRDAIARVEPHAAAGGTPFVEGAMVQDALIRKLEVIGAAVKKPPLDASPCCWLPRLPGVLSPAGSSTPSQWNYPRWSLPDTPKPPEPVKR